MRHFANLLLPLLVGWGCGGSTSGESNGGSSGSGGVASGGAAGASVDGGAAGSTSGGAPGLPPECVEKSACTLFSDCCTCTALGPNEKAPAQCEAACTKTKCEELGVDQTTVSCTLGRCIAGVNCDGTAVHCNAPPPACA